MGSTNSAFETTFSMLPTKGAEVGTSLGSNANSLIASGAVTAGAADGNAAVSIIRAGSADGYGAAYGGSGSAGGAQMKPRIKAR